MGNEILDLLLRLNLALAAGVVLALALRWPVRRWFGARVAYALWLLPLAAALMCFAPGRVETIVLDLSEAASAEAAAAQIPTSVWTLGWAFGALVSLAILTIRQARFTQSLGRLGAREDLGKRVCTASSVAHGPAVIGVLRPMIVTPADFDARFDAEERRLVLAHERAHLAHGDPWINAVVLALQCLNWFNPFVHVGARLLRIDQELACDAAVLAGAEGERRRYAEAMLKTHLSAAVPIGCAWPASDVASFKERIAMLKRTLPSRKQTLLGAGAILLATGAVAAVAWAAQPPRVVATYANETPDVADLVQPISADEEDLLGADEFNIDLDGDGVLIIDGEVVHARDLTPEQREELRETLADAREQMRAAREEVWHAREAIRDAMRNERAGYGLSEEEMASIRETLADVRLSQEEERRARAEALAEARVAMREAQIELAAASVAIRDMPDVREALREAEVEIARAMEEARVEGRRSRAEALERAAAALEAANQNGDITVNPDAADEVDVEDDEDN
ncbi:MAG TPA: M56 family metallopeptidase [Vitreimonas sp.]|nr:M56 family metallopeptidase [Vitreimonas sp.]